MESHVPLGGYLAVGLMMFIIGVIGVVIRRNPRAVCTQ